MKTTRVHFMVEKPDVGLKAIVFDVVHEELEDPVEIVRSEFDFTGVVVERTRLESLPMHRAYQSGGDLLAVRKTNKIIPLQGVDFEEIKMKQGE